MSQEPKMGQKASHLLRGKSSQPSVCVCVYLFTTYNHTPQMPFYIIRSFAFDKLDFANNNFVLLLKTFFFI